MNKDRQRHWAKLGAKVQLSELRQQIAEILRIYPDLRHAESSPAAGKAAGVDATFHLRLARP